MVRVKKRKVIRRPAKWFFEKEGFLVRKEGKRRQSDMQKEGIFEGIFQKKKAKKKELNFVQNASRVDKKSLICTIDTSINGVPQIAAVFD
jgi:hypothetical protein